MRQFFAPDASHPNKKSGATTGVDAPSPHQSTFLRRLLWKLMPRAVRDLFEAEDLNWVLLNDLQDARRQNREMQEIVDNLMAHRSADRAELRWLRGERAKADARASDTASWIDQIHEAGTADEQGVPLAIDEREPCQIIAFPFSKAIH